MAEDVALLELDNRAVEEMQVRAADCRSGDLENDIAVLDDLWLGAVNHLDFVLAHPCKSLHCLALVAPLLLVAGVGDILGSGGLTTVTNGLLNLEGSLGHHTGRVCSGVAGYRRGITNKQSVKSGGRW